ncbi:N-acyl-D-amino-acid deacylase family protein [Zavarzinella formosa]|uniref:N-acyl-D-amino-acid deacylase family protein n=1 Tax=Zavarzinella formosa TaxID=360055 RepID=UPI00030B96BC|nr:D-aminoacylase [Zavarzinella formosa]
MLDVLIRGGTVVDGSGLPKFLADVAIEGDRVVGVGRFPHATAKKIIDATGQVVAPGMIDAHVHGDLILLHDPIHEPAIRQGVTTYILGQDGVAFAPGTPETQQYMRLYTAGFNGNFPTPGIEWRTMAEYLDAFHHRVSMNVACLIPNGNVRMDVMGLAERRATPEEFTQMKRAIREAMEQGAVGLSTGLDYIPSLYADTAELVELCKEITPFGGVYVTHMRGYGPHNYIPSMDEVATIGREAGCGVHISHFNSIASQVIPQMDVMATQGAEVTFDLYCYLYGSTILGMITLPPEAQAGGVGLTLERLRDPAIRPQVKEWVSKPRFDLNRVRLGSVPADEYRHLEGKTLAEAVDLLKRPLGDVILDLLLATNMAVNSVVPHNALRTEADITALMRDPRMMGGSDGIYIGGKPHPRGTGCFAKYLGPYVRSGVWTIEEAVMKCSRHTARRHGLHDRGLLAPGMAADVIVFDPLTIQDRSTFDDGKLLATGMRDVIVNGEFVLEAGHRTNSRPGTGLRRK